MLFCLFPRVKAESTNLPILSFYETSVASDFGNGCEFEGIYTIRYRRFKQWRLADNVAYVLWQQSENGGISWTNIYGQSGVNKDELHVMEDGTTNLIFRAVVVSDSTEASAKKNAEYIGENGVPVNNKVKYTISKTLHSMLPEPTCDYDPDYLCTRYETFGLCSDRSCRYDTAVKVNKYIPGGTEEMTWGQYLICSNPDSAIYTKECEECPRKYQFSSIKDEDGNIIDSSATSKLLSPFSGDAFVFIMMSKDEYKKIPRLYRLFSGGQPLCPCKDYVFYTFISSVGSPSGTRIFPKITILDPKNGDTLASQTFFYTFKGFELYKPNLPFTPPSDYHNEGFIAVVELDYESTNAEGEKMSDYVTFTMDECAFSICGVRVPSHGSNVDRKPNKILSNGFYCRMDEGKRVGQWNGFEEWRYRHPNAAFLWQRKNSPDSPWVSLPAEKDTFFTYSWEEGEYHPMYKVILAESEEVIQQKLENGFPDDPCAIRTEPYNLGFYCEEYKCPKTKFTFVEDDIKAKDYDTTVYHNHTDDIKIILYQNDSETIDAFYIRGSEKPVLSESSGKKHTLYLPAEKGTFTIYAMNDTCKTDSVIFTIDKVCPSMEFSFVDGDFTAKNLDTTVYFNRTEDLKIVLYQNNSEPFDAFYMSGCDTPIKSESSGKKHTLYLPAEKGTVTIYAKNDTCKTDSVFFTIDKVCPSTEFSFVDGDFTAKNLDTTVYFNRTEDLKIVLYQNNSEPFDAFYMRGCDTPIKSESLGKKHMLYIPVEEDSVTIYAMSDTCVTDSVFFTIDKVCPKTEFTFVEGDFTAKKSETKICFDRSEDVEVVLYQNNDEPIDAFYVKGNESPIPSECEGKTHTLFLPAEEDSLTIYAMTDTCKTDSVFFSISKYGELMFEKIDDSGNREIVAEAKGGAGNYSYDFGDGFQSSNTLTDITYGKEYSITVKDEEDCIADTVFKTNKYELEFSPSFTPNGDGINDKWEIKNIEKYPSARITLYDRMGKKLMSATSESFDGWDGTYLGHPLPSTDYWYEISIDELDKIYMGHFTLYRGDK